MKRLFTLLATMLLGASLSFALPQDTGTQKTEKTAESGKKAHKGGKKGHKGGKKSKKGAGTETTTPPK
jgi:hypothetical protein